MEQQEKENSPIRSSGGIPAFASIALFLVGFYILMPLFRIILSSIPVLKEWRMGTFFIGEGAMLLSVFVVTLLIMQFLDHRPFSDLGFSLKGRGKDILYGFLMAVLIYAIGFAVCLLTGQIEVVGVHFHWSDLLLSGLFFAMVAIVEETMVRGYILGRLLRTRLNKFISLFISSFLFALLHLMNPNVAFLPMLNLVLGGLLLGAAYLYTRNLWFPISLHFFWNWIQGPVLGFEVSGNRFCETLFSLRLPANNLINGGAFGFEGSLVCTALATLFTLLIIWWFERLSQKTQRY
ncbi:CPBP family intramembrane metalloprotease [Bacteroides fragilis]|uniref:CPBP family intramembrane glutamic endopeptidase n=1 Tax=Bacteroides fragilis TaxID=817 RepID=UPI002030153E|nr:type II CAAX endopeptidase family protein [Bacteroides fragilis]MCM0324089.1 CPBP family intramembrane metalloprotease [Bacteroides fragilis]